MPGSHSASPANCLEHSLQDLVLIPALRRTLLQELRHCLFELDRELVDRCKAYLEGSPDEASMLYQTARSYMSEKYTRRPLYIAVHAIDTVLANPNFLREFYLILVVFVQFKDLAKKTVATHTLAPIFVRYFHTFYSRFHTFMPGSARLQTVDAFIRSEFSLLLIATSILNG